MKFYDIKDIDKFFEVINKCKGTVELVSKEGDRLNLESQLCKNVELAQLISDGIIEPEDMKALVDFMMEGKFE